MRDDRVVVHLSGGLGNQLFQFMAGVGLAEATGRELAINANFYRRPWIRHRNHVAYKMKRRLDIREFDEVANARRDRVLTPGDGRFERLLSRQTEMTGRRFGIASEESFVAGNWIKPLEIHRLVGYFMSPKYFLSSTAKGRFQKLVRPRHPWMTRMAERISADNAIGIHVRLGDYLQQGDIVVPSETYYLNGIDYLCEALGSKTKSFLFTDQPELFAIKYPKLASQVEIINPPSDVSTAENLLLLSQSTAFVCSNSTYSWWGTQISNTASALIVRPHTFYVSNQVREHSLDLWDPNSIVINSESGEKVN